MTTQSRTYTRPFGQQKSRPKLILEFVFLVVAVLSPLSFTGCAGPCKHFGFHEVSPGIYLGCAPRTEADFTALKEQGLRTILSLETFRYHTLPERRRAKRNGLRFVNIPILASPLAPEEASVKQALLALNAPSLRPVYVHCLYGRDRAAMLIGLYRVYYENWTPEDAWQEMLHNHFTVAWNLWGFKSFYWKHCYKKPPWVHSQAAQAGQQHGESMPASPLRQSSGS